MITLTIYWILLILMLSFAPYIMKLRVDGRSKYILFLFFIIFLILEAALRPPGMDGDYMSYEANYYSYRHITRDVESSFKTIAVIGEYLGCSSIFLFIFYAALSVSIKFLAIEKYSLFPVYSVCVWLSFSYLLHDMIQIRASVAAGLFLFFIPLIAERKYFKALIVLAFALFFHSSAIMMCIILPLKKDSINKAFWLGLYVIAWLINLKLLNIFSLIQQAWGFLPSFLEGRVGDASGNMYRLGDLKNINIYALYILVPSLYTIFLLFHAEKLKNASPYSLILIKTMILGVLIFSFNLPIISIRCFEFLSVSLIYLVPMICLCFKGKHASLISQIAIAFFCLHSAANLIIKQEYLIPV